MTVSELLARQENADERRLLFRQLVRIKARDLEGDDFADWCAEQIEEAQRIWIHLSIAATKLKDEHDGRQEKA